MPARIEIRDTEPGDAVAIAAIINQGIDDRVATFETNPQTPRSAAALIAASKLLLVAELDGALVGFARAGPYADDHAYYDGVAEVTMYVERRSRRTGIGRSLIEALAERATERGLHKLVGKVFTSNEPSIAMLRGCGWREVGVHLRHGTLDREWKDVLVVELVLSAAQRESLT